MLNLSNPRSVHCPDERGMRHSDLLNMRAQLQRQREDYFSGKLRESAGDNVAMVRTQIAYVDWLLAESLTSA